MVEWLMSKQIIVYSHGFGVLKEDRGLFTDIEAALPDAEHIMFDYNVSNAAKNTLTVSSLTKEVVKLAQVLTKVRTNYPEAKIDLVCHSQGCVVAAMLLPKNIRRTVLLTPPSGYDISRTLKLFGERPGAKIDINGLTSFPRRDGSTTIVPADYWTSRAGIEPITLYNALAQVSAVTIINGNRDEVLGGTDFSALAPSVEVIGINANHDFTGGARQEVVARVKMILNAQSNN